MMIIAVMIGAMLMPAQISAQNSRVRKSDGKVRIEKPRKNDNARRKDSEIKAKKNYNRNNCNKVVHREHQKPAPRPVVIHEHCNRPAPPPVVIHEHCNRPAPPPVVVHEHCNSDAAAGVAIAIGAAALISLLAN